MAIPADRIKEILPFASMLTVPTQPSILEGFLNLRGSLLAVIRLARLFDLPFTAGPYSPILVMRAGDRSVGLIVDVAEELLTIEKNDLRIAEVRRSANGCAEAEFSVDACDFVLLDSERILLVEERCRIEELEAQIDRRRTAVEAQEP